MVEEIASLLVDIAEHMDAFRVLEWIVTSIIHRLQRRAGGALAVGRQETERPRPLARPGSGGVSYGHEHCIALYSAMRFGLATSRRAEHPREDRVDVLVVIAEVEARLDLVGRKRGGDVGIGLQQFEQRQFAIGFPHLHRVALDPAV